ncbi:30S ribosomal protein S1 [bacterium]|nr:30S ribosomal protein S1 [bacterium]
MNTAEDFKTLFEESAKHMDVKEGGILKGVVVGLNRDNVMINVGFKSEGFVNKEEFRNFEGQIVVTPGDEIEVVVEQIEDANGVIVLSKERADALRSWDRVAEVFEKNGNIDGVVVNKIKGGMSVNLGGIKAFLPASQIDLKPVKSLDKLINQKYTFKILKLNKAKGNIVLSRRAILEVERESQKKDLLGNLREGQIVKGIVKNITDYGAFIDLGGIDGLLHITDISWGRVNHPSEVLKMGDEIEVAILKYDSDNEKVSLGLKQLQPDPWKDVDKQFTPGERVNGKIVNVTDYGVFVELAAGIEGLVHVSELTWSKKVKHPSKLVKVGDTVEAVILDVDGGNRRISLGVKQLEANPWNGLAERYTPGTKVKGTIRNITDFGVFLGIEGEDIDGLIHISDLTWDRDLKHPSDKFQKGQELEAIVLSVDKDNERFALGLKQLSDDPREATTRKFGVGRDVTGKVTDVDAKGVTVELEDGMQGHIGLSDLSAHERVDPKDKFKVGDTISAKVKKFDDRNNKVLLSVKAYEKDQEKANMRDFHAQQGDATVKLFDTLKTNS